MRHALGLTDPPSLSMVKTAAEMATPNDAPSEDAVL